ncbi:phosphate transport system regulatory protein PhoU [Synechococcus sp. PCC 7502]|uniref:phosphate signaling complex protein PhoU n=1 Tax=Synechococcus sp. PCC 7502 TaxID=1173263 RepID=UPI00029FD30C|nr:phosphate signaling complex protein PhoU [Synechococcus sp. PCC 7502]AFY72737.1 phosphate transport system regulatory protein PhoU [Synechococcus sp. PCC 7502]
MLELPASGQKYSKPHFERQMRRLEQDALRMGALVEQSSWLAHTALFDRNLEAAMEIDAQDKRIDQYYRQIEVDCMDLIALQSPVARDLRLLTALIHLVRDLERIGDYAENLGEIAIKLFSYPAPNCMAEVEVMSNRCRAMLALSLSALSNLDADLGLQIKQKDDAVDSDYANLYNLIAQQKNSETSLEPIMLLVLAIHHLERMADHAANVGQRVAYIITGKRH